LGTAGTEQTFEKLPEKLVQQQDKVAAFDHKLREWTTTMMLSCFYIL